MDTKKQKLENYAHRLKIKLIMLSIIDILNYVSLGVELSKVHQFLEYAHTETFLKRLHSIKYKS